MPTDRLVIAGEFDPSGIVKGLDIGIASVEQFEAALRKSVQRLPQLTQSEQAFADGARVVAQEVKAAATEATVLEQRIRSMGDATGKARISLESSARATNLLRGGLTQLAVHATGASGAIGQVGQALAFMVGGAGVAVAVAGVIGALVLAYQALTKSTREAAKATEDFIKQQRKVAESDLTPGAAFQKRFKDLTDNIDKLKARFAEIQRTNVALGIVGLQPEQVKIVEDIQFLMGRLRHETEAWNQTIAEAEGGMRDVAAATRTAAVAAANAAAATSGLGFHTQGSGGRDTGLPLPGGTISGATDEEIAAHRQQVADATKATAEETARLTQATADWAQEEADALRASEEVFGAQQQARIQATVDAIAGLSFVLSNVADALGIVDQKAQQALSAMTSLGIAIATGDIFGAIGSGIGVISSLFGDDSTQREHAAIMEANTQALEDLRDSVDEWSSSIEAVQSAQTVLGGLDPAVLAALDRFKSGGGLGGQGLEFATNLLDSELRKAGSSLAELDKIARANGIQLLDEKGRLVAGALDILREQLKLTAEEAARNTAREQAEEQKRAAEKFAEDWKRTQEIIADSERREAEKWAQELEDATDRMNRFLEEVDRARIAFAQDTRARLDLRRRLTPEDEDPFAIFADQLSGLFSGASIPDVIQEALGNLDLNTPDLRDSFRDRLIGLLDAINQGAMTPEELGLTSDQFNQLLADSADFLDTFKDAVDDVTSSMLNVPKGLNVMEQEWRARLANPEPFTPTAPHAPLGPVPFTPFTPPEPWEGGPARPGGRMITESAAQWTINVNGVTDPAAVADMVLSRVRRVSGAVFGDTQRWSQL